MIYDIKKVYLMVWRFRSEVEQSWPTPPPADSFRFAFCESSESLDAWLRLNPAYKRNQEIETDNDALLNELADCAMMILTALGPDKYINKPTSVVKMDIDQICLGVSNVWLAWTNRRGNPTRWITLAISLVNSIANCPDMNLEERLQARLDRIREKHVKPELVTA